MPTSAIVSQATFLSMALSAVNQLIVKFFMVTVSRKFRVPLTKLEALAGQNPEGNQRPDQQKDCRAITTGGRIERDFIAGGHR